MDTMLAGGRDQGIDRRWMVHHHEGRVPGPRHQEGMREGREMDGMEEALVEEDAGAIRVVEVHRGGLVRVAGAFLRAAQVDHHHHEEVQAEADVIAPHPEIEVVREGGVLAMIVTAAREVVAGVGIVVVTDGGNWERHFNWASE